MSYVSSGDWFDTAKGWYEGAKSAAQDPRVKAAINAAKSKGASVADEIKGKIRTEAAAGATAATKKVMLYGGLAIIAAVLLLRR